MPNNIDNRAEQLGNLSALDFDGSPIVIHGSLGHAMMMGSSLPGAVKPTGVIRDIDIFAIGAGKQELESLANNEGCAGPSPVDAGLSMLIEREGENYFLSKDGVRVTLEQAEVLDATVLVSPPELGGVPIRTFAPVAMLAAHMLEPKPTIRQTHKSQDKELERWFRDKGITVPLRFASSVEEFHSAYAEAFPYKAICERLADIYVRTLPESLRKLGRAQTHRLMSKYAGRYNPFASE